MSQNLNDNLLQQFAETFFGFGNLRHPLWFIGMEEGGGRDYWEIERRLSVWNQRPQALVDLVEFHRKAFPDDEKVKGFFTPTVKHLQRTWNGLIRTFLSYQGEEAIRTELVKEFQGSKLGRENINGNGVALLELFPLPSPGLKDWKYKEWSSLPFLKTRDIYREKIAAIRVDGVKKLIQAHSPQVVVFYGFSYKGYWERIAGPLDEKMEGIDAYSSFSRKTHFVLMKHPVARKVNNSYFETLGKYLRKLDLPKKSIVPPL